jgi:hypothetical protein
MVVQALAAEPLLLADGIGAIAVLQILFDVRALFPHFVVIRHKQFLQENSFSWNIASPAFGIQPGLPGEGKEWRP